MRPPRLALPLYARHAQSALNYLCYALILCLYLVDLSFVRGILRCILQGQFLYKNEQTISRPALAGSVLVFTFCAAVHLFGDLPRPGPLAHGYNHGGLFIDFVGQRPISRLRLVSLDVLLLVLQAVLVELVYLSRVGFSDAQSLDDEERGELSEDYGKIVLQLGQGLSHFLKTHDDGDDDDDEVATTTAIPRQIPVPRHQQP